MVLFLNTASFEQLHFAVLDSKTAKVLAQKKYKITHPETEKALEFLQAFLSGAKVKISAITQIYIASGPGSFTGIRAGFSHALAFSMALGVPVYALTKEQIPANLSDILKLKLKKLPKSFNPEYGREPNIT